MNIAPALEIRALEKRFSRFTLGPLDLTIPSGAIYGLIGPNGAGKTTLIDQIFGMGAPDCGAIKVLGLDHALDDVAMKQRVGYASPELNFLVWGRVEKAIRFVRGFRPSWDEAYAARLMELFSLNPGDKIATLSFGAKTKLALLLAMAWHPQMLVLDEPTTGLDAHSKRAVFAELLAIVRDESRTVVISSHQLSDLERFADHVGILHRGRLVAEGAMAELVERHVFAEFVAESEEVQQLRGLRVQEHEGARWRVVLDTAVCAVESLTQYGARDVRTQALTLEELFLVLTK
ncbi:MAG TPA: ABC transporter ATP-binding protein [Chthoniobacteraceae bacterium]|jgi:ABC-2 type transport system ATP-binding protein